MSIIMPHLLLQYTTRYFYIFYISVMQCKYLGRCIPRQVHYIPTQYLFEIFHLSGNRWETFFLILPWCVHRCEGVVERTTFFVVINFRLNFGPFLTQTVRIVHSFGWCHLTSYIFLPKKILKCSKFQNVVVMLNRLQSAPIIVATNIQILLQNEQIDV